MFVMNKVGENNNKFDTIVRNSGNGGVIDVKLTDENVLIIQNAEFTKCAAIGIEDDEPSSRGGAIYVKYNSNSATLTVKDVTFTDCMATKYGGGIGLWISSKPKEGKIEWSNVQFSGEDA